MKNLNKYWVVFKDGKSREVRAVRYERINGLYLFYHDSPNLGQFIPEELVKSVDPIPEKENKMITPFAIEPKSED